jgi:hypothetical protein
MNVKLRKDKTTTLGSKKEEGKRINVDHILIGCEAEGCIEVAQNRIQLWPLFPAVLSFEILLLLN